MNKIFLSTVLAALALPTFGQEVKSRTAVAPQSSGTLSPVSVARKAAGPKLVSARKAVSAETSAAWILEYGERVDVFSEDFSKMTTGSIGKPDLDTDILIANPESPWTNVNPAYTDQPGWGAWAAYPAGGAVAVFDEEGLEDYAHINTPRLDLSANDGVAVLEFRARTNKKNNSTLIVEAAETYNMSPTWKIMEEAYMDFDVTPEWQTYQFVFRGCESSTIFNIVPQSSPSIYIDDLKVFQVKPYIGMPKTLPHSDYKGDSFTANWQPVEGADYYLLSVKEYNAELEQWDEFIDEAKVEGTSFVVSETKSGVNYSYTVYAVKDGHTSLPGDEVFVVDLAAPVMGGTTLTEKGYHAEWTEVPSAEVYNYWALNERVAKEDGKFYVTKCDFDNVLLADGSEPTMNLGDEPLAYDDTYVFGVDQAGWHATNYMPFVGGFVAMDAYFYIYQGSQSGIISPAMDLSKNGGNIDLSMKLMGERVAWWDNEGKKHENIVQCAVALFNYDEKSGDFLQAELIYPGDIQEEWGTYTAHLTKGAKQSKIGIFAVTMPGYLYVDDLFITQEYKAGESLVEPFHFERYYEDTAIDVTVPERVKYQHLYHEVSAIKTDVQINYGDIVESRFSDRQVVQAMEAGISTPSMENAAVVLRGNALTVANPAGESVEVFAADGRRVAADHSAAASVNLNLSVPGTYIVRVGGKSIKIAF